MLFRALPNASKVSNNLVNSSNRFFVFFPSKCPAMVLTSAGAASVPSTALNAAA